MCTPPPVESPTDPAATHRASYPHRLGFALVVCMLLVLSAGLSPAQTAEPDLQTPPGPQIHGEVYLALAGLISVAIMAVARRAGLRHAALLGLSVLLLHYVMLPLMARPWPPVAVAALGFFALSIGVGIVVLRGKPESWAGLAASAAAFAVAWFLATRVIQELRLTGFGVGVVSLLVKTGYGRAPGQEGFPAALLVSAAIVGAIGAVMDIAVDISATIRELREKDPQVPFWDAARSGYHVGTDVLATMANTLILAYIGVLLPLFLVPYIRFSVPGMQWHVPLFELMNNEELSFEWANGLIGTLALILAVPTVAVLSAALTTTGAALSDLWQRLSRGCRQYDWGALLWRLAAITALVAAAYLLVSRQYAVHQDWGGGQVVRAEVTRQLPPVDVDGQPGQLTEYRICSGPLAGRYAITTNIMRKGPLWIPPSMGDRQLIRVRTTPAGAVEGVVVYSHERDRKLLMLTWILLTALVVLAGSKGLRAVVGLLGTVALVFGVFFPLVVAHVPPLAAFALVALASTAITFLAVSGWNLKTAAAVCATMASLILAGCLCYASIRLAGLDGLGAGVLRVFMKAYSTAEHLDFVSLLAAGILLGVLGALMDVVMAVSSAMQEVRSAHPDLSPKAWAASGMNVGRSVAAMMSVTLLFAYAGGSLPLFLYVTRLGKSVHALFMLGEVLMCMLIGVFALVIAVPLTVRANAMLLRVYAARGWSLRQPSRTRPAPSRSRPFLKWALVAASVALIGVTLARFSPRPSWQDHLQRAHRAYRERMWMQAAHGYWEALDRMPEGPGRLDAQRRLLRTYRHLLDARMALYMIELATQLLEREPDSPEGHYLLGVALDRQARLNEALDAYQRAKGMLFGKSLPAEMADLDLKMAMALSKLRRPDEAAQALLEAARSPHAWVLVELSRHLRDQGNLEGARAALRRAQQLAPGDERIASQLRALTGQD